MSAKEHKREREELILQSGYLDIAAVLRCFEENGGTCHPVLIVASRTELCSHSANLQIYFYIFSHLTSHFALYTDMAHTE